jgi:hypothetical protein
LSKLRLKNEVAKTKVKSLKDSFEKQMMMQKESKSKLNDLESKEDAKQQLLNDQIQ